MKLYSQKNGGWVRKWTVIFRIDAPSNQCSIDFDRPLSPCPLLDTFFLVLPWLNIFIAMIWIIRRDRVELTWFKLRFWCSRNCSFAEIILRTGIFEPESKPWTNFLIRRWIHGRLYQFSRIDWRNFIIEPTGSRRNYPCLKRYPYIKGLIPIFKGLIPIFKGP